MKNLWCSRERKIYLWIVRQHTNPGKVVEVKSKSLSDCQVDQVTSSQQACHDASTDEVCTPRLDRWRS